MVSAAEQLAANLNFSALAKAEELKKRIWFTLGALLVYRIGTYIAERLGRAHDHPEGFLEVGAEQADLPVSAHFRLADFITHDAQSDVWPKYFDTYQCGKSDCHDASSGHGFFRLASLAGVVAPQPTAPVTTWPMAWQQNLQAVQHNISCSDPLQSAVLAVPEGRGQPHPPGVVVTDAPSADALFQMWLK